MPKSEKVVPQTFQLKLTLRDLRPPIWRRLLVSNDTTLGKLHYILQVAFGWDAYHLHLFRVAGQEYSNPQFELESLAEGRAKLGQLIKEPRFKFTYEYDFGDSWEVEILVEKILPFDDQQVLPRITHGKRAGPIEDSGGVWGYEYLVEILRDPNHPEYAERMEWIFGDEWEKNGDRYDPEAFSLDEMNKKLQRLR